MRALASLDTEDNTKGKIYWIDFFDGQNHFSFRNAKAAIQFLNRSTLEIWSCNLEYDIFNLFGYAFFNRCKFKLGDRVLSVTYKQNIFFDTINHWKIPVKKMGEIIGQAKLETKSFNNLEYCQNDAEIVYCFVKRMKEEMSGFEIPLKLTCASTAFDYWRKNYWRKKFKKLDRDDLRYLNRAYYGGRTECFFVGKLTGNIKFFDVNAMYPFVMSGEYPYPFMYQKKIDLKKFGVTECLVRSKLKIPVLPYRTEAGKLIFPNGKFRGIWSNTELRFAISKGVKIIKTYSGLVYKKTGFYFKDFVNQFYTLRQKAVNDYQKMIFKLMMNSLYGKFGQVNDGTRIITLREFLNDRFDKVRNYKLVNGDIILYTSGKHYPIFCNMIWALETTAKARILLYQFIEKLSKFGQVLYCDTDSIFLNTRRKIKTSQQLGDLKLAGEYKRIEIISNKFYRYGDRLLLYNKIKGIPYGNMSDFFQRLQTTFKRPIRMKEGLRRKLPINCWIEHTKRMRQGYDKGIINPSGIVTPINL